MQRVTLENSTGGQQAFVIKDGGQKLGEMIMDVKGDTLTVYHTEVFATEGKGLGTELLNAMVEHARQHHLKVVPQCVFVLVQFKRHPDLYADIWKKSRR